ncbi:EboA domain-containing protein [Streptomyces spiramenti]|uniref:Sugar phosphate isomerase n=1 Tax=Streptomyces spiramenti TaxID=2720606 RepID=A0ABX1AI73_9ACTN|nr:EboA domain-containing protein [Streptomyces spiramenti]NJP65366.1 sugar phosphate isomerase [Streptomyces spiramenti]
MTTTPDPQSHDPADSGPPSTPTGDAVAAPGETTALREALDGALDAPLAERLSVELREAADPSALGRRFPAAGRRYGRGPLPGGPAGWRVEDAVRTLLLLQAPPGEVTALAGLLYRQGDAAERRGVLRALPHLPVGDGALELVRDALRANDPRLVEAAVGPYAARHLDQPAWRQAVLKCLFVEVPLRAVAGLAERRDAELVSLAEGLAAERLAAGRAVPADLALIAPG